MPKAKWIITDQRGEKAAVYDKADLQRRQQEAERAGVKLTTRKAD